MSADFHRKESRSELFRRAERAVLSLQKCTSRGYNRCITQISEFN